MMPELLLTFPSPLVRSPVEEAPGDALSAMRRGMRRSRCHAGGGMIPSRLARPWMMRFGRHFALP